MAPKKAPSNIPVKTPIHANIRAVPARENATGKPASRIRHITPNINNGINSTILKCDVGFKNFRNTL